VDESGNARITDFGLTTVAQHPDSMQSASGQHSYTPRWTAPEVLRGETHSKEADVFAFAMVMTEVRHGGYTACRTLAYCGFISMQVFTGAVPFNDLSSNVAMFTIMRGERPPRPTYPTFTDDLWILMQRCWEQGPPSRPEASGVTQVLLTL